MGHKERRPLLPLPRPSPREEGSGQAPRPCPSPRRESQAPTLCAGGQPHSLTLGALLSHLGKRVRLWMTSKSLSLKGSVSPEQREQDCCMLLNYPNLCPLLEGPPQPTGPLPSGLHSEPQVLRGGNFAHPALLHLLPFPLPHCSPPTPMQPTPVPSPATVWGSL